MWSTLRTRRLAVSTISSFIAPMGRLSASSESVVMFGDGTIHHRCLQGLAHPFRVWTRNSYARAFCWFKRCSCRDNRVGLGGSSVVRFAALVFEQFSDRLHRVVVVHPAHCLVAFFRAINDQSRQCRLLPGIHRRSFKGLPDLPLEAVGRT